MYIFNRKSHKVKREKIIKFYANFQVKSLQSVIWPGHGTFSVKAEIYLIWTNFYLVYRYFIQNSQSVKRFVKTESPVQISCTSVAAQETKNHSLTLNLNGLWGVLNCVSVTGISALTDWKPIFPIENNVFKVNKRLQYNSNYVFIVFLLYRVTF